MRNKIIISSIILTYIFIFLTCSSFEFLNEDEFIAYKNGVGYIEIIDFDDMSEHKVYNNDVYDFGGHVVMISIGKIKIKNPLKDELEIQEVLIDNTTDFDLIIDSLPVTLEKDEEFEFIIKKDTASSSVLTKLEIKSYRDFECHFECILED